MAVELLVHAITGEITSAALPGRVDWSKYAAYTEADWWLIEQVDDPELEARLLAHNGKTLPYPYVELPELPDSDEGWAQWEEPT
ncbi:MAG TPA: hypothetical protein VM487_21020 [Phycisphaerae bacterium]|nr:hypothetical protein [Phycisphaerae bacterium]